MGKYDELYRIVDIRLNWNRVLLMRTKILNEFFQPPLTFRN